MDIIDFLSFDHLCSSRHGSLAYYLLPDFQMDVLISTVQMRLLMALSFLCFHSHKFRLRTEALLVQSDSRSRYIIQVCENKNCVKQFPTSAAGGDGLIQLFSDLIHPMANHIVLQSSGCLSQCGRGPNVCITTNPKSNIYFGVKDAYIVGDLLKDECNIEISPILLAAVDVMAQANRGTSFLSTIRRIDSKNKTIFYPLA